MRRILAGGALFGFWLAGLAAPALAADAPVASLSAARPAAAPAPAVTLGPVRPAATLGIPRPLPAEGISAPVARGQNEEPPILTAPMPRRLEEPIRPVPAEPPVVSTPLPGGCDGGSSGPCDTGFAFDAPLPAGLQPASRWYVGTDYLLWWTSRATAPPLVSTGPAASDGILGNGGQVLAGGGTVFPQQFDGIRVNAGYWFDDCQWLGIDGSIFVLGRREGDATFTSAGFPVLARPFFNVNQNTEFSEVIASPGLAAGGASIHTQSELWGADINLRENLWCGCFTRLDALYGFRYLDLREELQITETFLGDPANPAAAGRAGTVTDLFRTTNQFYGGQLGLAGEVRYGRWFTDLRAKVALGSMHEAVEVRGGQALLTPAGPLMAGGGLLALPGNSGRFERDRFAVVPEAGLNLGFYLTERLRLYTGYTFVYASNVVRPGDQIDRALNVQQIPNFPLPNAPSSLAARPAVPFKETGFWAQGINFGLQFNW